MKAATKCYNFHTSSGDYLIMQADSVRDGPAFPFLFNGRRYISGLDESARRVSIDQEHIVAVEETTCECVRQDYEDGEEEETKVRDLGPNTVKSKEFIERFERMREYLGISDIFTRDNMFIRGDYFPRSYYAGDQR